MSETLIAKPSEPLPLGKRIWEMQGILIAVLPVLGSFLAITYELGYLNWFDVPLEFAEITLLRIVGATVTLTMAVLLMLHGISVAATAISEAKSPVEKVVIKAIGVTGVIATVLYLWRDAPQARWWAVPAVFIGLLTFHLVPPLFSRKSDIAYMAELENFQRTTSRKSAADESHPLRYLREVLFLTFLTMLLGRFNAGDNTERYVVEEEPNLLFVRKYGDNIILKRFDPESGVLLRPFEVRNLGEGGSIKLKRVKVVIWRGGGITDDEPAIVPQRLS
jgi:hypothetical protein